MKLILTAASLAIALTSTMIGTQAGAQNIMVEYHYSCAQWSEARSDYYNQGLARGWLVGMLNGLGLASRSDFWRTGSGLEPEQVFFWMDRYCDNNPLSYATTGVFMLMTERLGEGWNAE